MSYLYISVYLTGQLGVSSCSSTLILDSDDIPAIVMFKAQIRYIIVCYAIFMVFKLSVLIMKTNLSDLGGDEQFLPITSTKTQVGTLEELLTLGRDRGKDVLFF